MMKVDVLFVVAAIASAEVCFNVDPSGDVNKCNECTKMGGTITGGQCQVQNRWMNCHTSIEDCCSTDPEMNQDADICVKNSKAGSGDIDCDTAVTKNRNQMNKDCQAKCKSITESGKNPKDDSSFTEGCMFEDYTVQDDRTIVSGQCFNKWVYGYSESLDDGNDHSFYEDKKFTDIKTPALCQAKCQEEEDCVNWLWTSESVTGASQYDNVPHVCRLKNQRLVTGALNTKYIEPQYADKVDPTVCNVVLGYKCWEFDSGKDGYRCLPCEGNVRCVWESSRHIAGWKYCSDDNDVCAIPEPDFKPTEAPEPGPTDAPEPEPKPTNAPEPDWTVEYGQKLVWPHALEL